LVYNNLNVSDTFQNEQQIQQYHYDLEAINILSGGICMKI